MSAPESPPKLPGAIRAMPRRAVSQAVGALARVPLPPVLGPLVLKVYARAFGADLAEAARPVGAYGSVLDFFTRTLVEGARPLPSDPAAIVSPSDGKVHVAGDVTAGMLLQAKGVPYALSELLGCAATALSLEGGSQVTIHLAPGDYHRFHWPFDALVDEVRHLPGDLWPVFPKAAEAVPRLFARNERVVVSGRLPAGGTYAVVAVGALDVGSIRLAFHPVRTNRGGPARPRTWRLEDVRAERGDELGFFEMGSTLVVLVSADGGRIDPLAPGSRVRACAPLGHTCPHRSQ